MFLSLSCNFVLWYELNKKQTKHFVMFSNTVTGLLPGHLFSSGEMAGGRSKISSALNRLALEIPLNLYCVVFTNIIEHT